MTANASHLMQALHALPAEDRAEIATLLIESLDEQCESDFSAECDADLARRKAEILRGKAVGIPAAEVFATLREKYA